MSAEEYRLLIPQFLMRQLSPEEIKAFEARLAQDSALRAETEEMRGTWDGLSEIGALEPSSGLRARFYERLASATEQSRTRRSRLFGLWPVRPAWQAAFTVAVFGAGLLVGLLSRQTSVSQVAELQGEVQRMRQMVAISLLSRQSATARLEGVSWSSRIDEPGGEISAALFSALNHDPNVNVRLSAVDALGELGDDKKIRRALIESIPAQPSPLVQIALIDALVQAGAREAGPELTAISSDTQYNRNVRQRSQWALQRLKLQ
jgi:HEAT repeat protein